MTEKAYQTVTEFGGQQVSQEQIYRLWHRYNWALRMLANRDVVEAGCGAGHGVSVLQGSCKSLVAGDVSDEVLRSATRVFENEFTFQKFDACQIPVENSSVDVLILFEAIYYVEDVSAFLNEARRILRPGGIILLAMPNKQLFDFTPSPFATNYFTPNELRQLLAKHDFESKFYGFLDTNEVSTRQKILRPLKWLANNLGLMPKTMRGKELLKSLFFGGTVLMPSKLDKLEFGYEEPSQIEDLSQRCFHKVIYCKADLK